MYDLNTHEQRLAALEVRLMQLEQALAGAVEQIEQIQAPARNIATSCEVLDEPRLHLVEAPPDPPIMRAFRELKAEQPFQPSPYASNVILTAGGRQLLACYTAEERDAILLFLNRA